MIQKVIGAQPFQILADNFTIGPAEVSYVLQISADGANFSDLFTVAANTTRLVTNVANGSYYKLKNNTGEVSVNWRTQCGGGSGEGGSYTLPTASSDTLGGVKIGNGISIDTDGKISAAGGVPVVDEFPETANVGDIVAKSQDNIFEVGYWDYYGLDTRSTRVYTFDGGWNIRTLILLSEVPYTGKQFKIYSEADGTIKFYSYNQYDDIEELVGTVSVDSPVTYSTVTVSRTEEALTVNNASSVITLSNIKTNSTTHNLFEYVDGGEYGKVVGGPYYYTIYIPYIPNDIDTVKLFKFGPSLTASYEEYNFVLNKANDCIDVYNAKTDAYISSINKGEYGEYASWVLVCTVSYDEGVITVETSPDGYLGYSHYSDFNDFHTESAFWKAMKDDSKADALPVSEGQGIPYWNSQGVISRKVYDVFAKEMYVNTNSYEGSNRWTLLTATNNLPSRIWVPKTGGTNGQVLTSAGGGEPTWSTLIKSVQITQDAYDALVDAGTTDPNTLYLIVEE